MIIAEFNPKQNLVRFSDPFERFTSTKATAQARCQAEVERMVYFKNRKHIYETLRKWLNQRAHALQSPQNRQLIATISFDLDTKQGSYYSLCAYVRKNCLVLKSIAPAKESRFYSHYRNVILPVLNDCITQAQ